MKIKFSVGDTSWLKAEIIHRFPSEFEELTILSPCKNVWEELNISTKDRPFLVPAIPTSCFEGDNIRTEQYQSWPEGNRECKTYGKVGVVIYNNDKVVGTMRWYWWGHGKIFKASEFSFCLLHKNKLIKSFVDIRPSHELPTCSSTILVDKLSVQSLEKKLISEERSIKSLKFIFEN